MNDNIYYKYRGDSTYTEEILKSGKVYLSTASGLNDPFECSLQEIGKDWILDEIKKLQSASVGGFIFTVNDCIKKGTNFFGLSKNEIIPILEKIRSFENIGDATAYREEIMLKLTGHSPANSEKMLSQIDSQLLSVGIFSMSTKPEHPLMWAHYAGDHTGICIGFKKTEHSRLSSDENFLPVIYSDSLPEIPKDGLNVQMNFSIDDYGRLYTSSYKIAFSDRTFQKAVTTKSTCWSYEDEYRYIEPFPGLFDWPGQISDITFGLRCKEDRKNYYIKLVEENIPYPISFFVMQKKRGTNELERVPFDYTSSKPSETKPKDTNSSTDKLAYKDFIAKMESLIRQEKYGEVIFQTTENLNIRPNDPDLLCLKGTAHGFAQEPKKALSCFKKVTELHPDVAHGWYQMACALVDLSRDEDAIKALKIAYNLDPNDPSIAFNLGIELLKIQRDPDEALIYLKRADKLGHRRAYGFISDLESKL